MDSVKNIFGEKNGPTAGACWAEKAGGLATSFPLPGVLVHAVDLGLRVGGGPAEVGLAGRGLEQGPVRRVDGVPVRQEGLHTEDLGGAGPSRCRLSIDG